MKKLSILSIIFLASFQVTQAQFFGMSLGNYGVNMNAGLTLDRATLMLSYNGTITSRENPSFGKISAGYEINITQHEEDNLVLTPFVGFAKYSYMDFSVKPDGEKIEGGSFVPNLE